MSTNTSDEPGSPWKVVFYETAAGNSPPDDWLRGQPARVQAKFAWIFDLLEENGTDVGRPYVAPVRDKIWEVRWELNRVQYRLLYFAGPGRTFVMLHGLTKARKIPPADSGLAEQRMADHLVRLRGARKGRSRG